jgi:large conductance mechanosensitive channel protein
MPKFQVYKDTARKYRFRLRADNNKIIAVGEAYETYASCMNGIRSIQRNFNAPVEDTTVEGQQFSNPKFQIYKDNAGKFRFHLNARNGEIIADSSEGYETKDACLNGIAVVGQSSTAEIKDLTQSEEIITENIGDTAPAMSAEAKTPKNSEISKSEGIKMDREDEILEELKKIRASLEKAPPPPPPIPPKGLWMEFKDFLKSYKVLGLAVAFVIGLYLGGLVQALVKDFIMPLIGLVIPGLANLSTLKIGFPSTIFDASGNPPTGYAGQIFSVGDFLVALITFIIVAFIVFLIVKVAKKWKID